MGVLAWTIVFGLIVALLGIQGLTDADRAWIIAAAVLAGLRAIIAGRRDAAFVKLWARWKLRRSQHQHEEQLAGHGKTQSKIDALPAAFERVVSKVSSGRNLERSSEQPTPHPDATPLSGEEYLMYRETELGSAVRSMGWDSAWGRWYASQQLAMNGACDDWSLMNVAAHKVVDAFMDGGLAARGRTPPGIVYEPIPRETWRLAALQVHSDVACLWKIVPVPRSGVDPGRIGALLGYDSVVVDSRQFLNLWPTKEQTHDVARRLLLERAQEKNADPAAIARLS